jgi:hypothetical protein
MHLHEYICLFRHYTHTLVTHLHDCQHTGCICVRLYNLRARVAGQRRDRCERRQTIERAHSTYLWMYGIAHKHSMYRYVCVSVCVRSVILEYKRHWAMCARIHTWISLTRRRMSVNVCFSSLPACSSTCIHTHMRTHADIYTFIQLFLKCEHVFIRTHTHTHLDPRILRCQLEHFCVSISVFHPLFDLWRAISGDFLSH